MGNRTSSTRSICEPLPQPIPDHQVAADQRWHFTHERGDGRRAPTLVGGQDPAQHCQRLLVEHHGLKVPGTDPGDGQAGLDGVHGEVGIVLAAAEPLLLGGGHHPAIDAQRGCGVVVVAANAEDGSLHGSTLDDCSKG